METKDYITLSVSIVSVLISILTFVRVIINERRSFSQPYFKDTWKRTRVALETHLDAVESWFSWFEGRYSKRETDRGYRYPRGLEKIELDLSARNYAKDLARALDRYLAAVDGLSSEIENYNNLFDPTSKPFHALMTYGVFQISWRQREIRSKKK
jgi:hypothetical protein